MRERDWRLSSVGSGALCAPRRSYAASVDARTLASLGLHAPIGAFGIRCGAQLAIRAACAASRRRGCRQARRR